MTRRRLILPCLGLIAALAVVGWFAGLCSFIQSAAVLQLPAQLQKLDAIVVLTGGSNRVDAGFDLLEKGLGKKLFISGVYRGIEVKNLLKRWKAEPQSNLDCCVVLGFEADNTAGNAIETVNWLRKENFHSVYLVTANYHIKRAMLEFDALAPDLHIVPFPVIPDRTDLSIWWKDSVTRNLVLREYLKYIAVYCRYEVLSL
ncbi:MAG: YdcF family protein [Proteobacteria bacterium]|nr:YdcF family protein [Pseudomonadota bacterium]